MLNLLKINADLYARDMPLGMNFDEFSRLNGMDDDLFEAKIPKPPRAQSVEQQYDYLKNRDLENYEPRKCYDEYERMFAEAVVLINGRLIRLIDITLEQWLDLKFGDHRKVNKEVMECVVSMWLIRSYKKQFEEYMKIKRRLEVSRIDRDVECDPTNAEFAIWLASKFNVLTGDLPGFKTYEDYKNTWLYEWNNYKWYKGLEDGELKEEALKEKSILEGSWGHETRKGMNLCAWLKQCFRNYQELDHKLLTMLQKYWWGVKDEEESSGDAWTHYSPIDEWKDYEHTTYIRTDVNSNQITYNNICQIFMDHAGITNDDADQADQGWFDSHEPMEDNDDDIGDLDDYLSQNYDTLTMLMKKKRDPRKEASEDLVLLRKIEENRLSL
ncbi:hypothetical protein Tco_0216177 [Tanacetum coccineum]